MFRILQFGAARGAGGATDIVRVHTQQVGLVWSFLGFIVYDYCSLYGWMMMVVYITVSVLCLVQHTAQPTDNSNKYYRMVLVE